MRTHPFFATLLLHTTVVVCDKVPTMGVTGTSQILINPEFADTLTDAEFCGVVIHEVLHLAFKHVLRIDTLPDPPKHLDKLRLANYAADVVVNGIIHSTTPAIALPDGHVHHPEMSTWSLPAIYAHLLQNLPDCSQQQVCMQLGGESSGDDGTDSEGGGTGEQAQGTVDWDEVLQTAIMREQMSSSRNSALLSHLNTTINNDSVVDYRAILSQFLLRSSDVWGYEYDRRFIHQEVYIDTLSNDSLNLQILIDTSGSIDTDLLSTFVSEVYANLCQSRWAIVHTTVHFFDTKLYPAHSGPDILEKLINNDYKIPGGGGTDFSCFTKPDALHTDLPVHSSTLVTLIYTDGYSYDTLTPDSYQHLMPIVWCCPAPHETNPELLTLSETLGSTILHVVP